MNYETHANKTEHWLQHNNVRIKTFGHFYDRRVGEPIIGPPTRQS